MQQRHGCPVQATIEVLAGKWKVKILWRLSYGELRFAQLRKKVGTVSEKVLTEQLRQLEKHGVIARRVSDSVPPAVTYSLNDAGRNLVVLMESLCDWGSAHFHIKPTLPRRAAKAAAT
jgi:DNA-binding HxlR family transcriptional regulator